MPNVLKPTQTSAHLRPPTNFTALSGPILQLRPSQPAQSPPDESENRAARVEQTLSPAGADHKSRKISRALFNP
jgi:hypothetical protein